MHGKRKSYCKCCLVGSIAGCTELLEIYRKMFTIVLVQAVHSAPKIYDGPYSRML